MTATPVDRLTSELVTVEISGSLTDVRLTATGEIDSSSAPVVRQHLDALLDDDILDLTVDLCGVTFLDSAGLCVLAAAHRRASAQGVQMRVLAASRAVIRPLEITGLWQLLHAEQVETPGADEGAA